MIRVLFVCHGNICRSPMAQFIFSDLASKAGVLDKFEIDSAATSTEEIGNSIYPPARKILALYGINNVSHRARQMTMNDYRNYDVIKVMDFNNLYNARRITGGDLDNKISMLLESEVSDPWYSGDFETCYNDILKGCTKLLSQLSDELSL